MRNFLLTLSLVALTTIGLQAQRVNGEGSLVKKEIQLDQISGIGLAISADVYITQGSPQKVEIEAQQNIIDNIERNVRGGVWNIKHDRSVRDAKQITIYITMSNLSEVALSGSGKLETTNMFSNANHFKAAVSGSGKVKVQIEANEIDAAISGSGKIFFAGSAETLNMAISGSGDLHALDLEAGDCSIAISGSGSADVYVKNELEGAVSGSGNIHYKGDTAKVKARVSGSGNVKEIQ